VKETELEMAVKTGRIEISVQAARSSRLNYWGATLTPITKNAGEILHWEFLFIYWEDL